MRNPIPPYLHPLTCGTLPASYVLRYALRPAHGPVTRALPASFEFACAGMAHRLLLHQPLMPPLDDCMLADAGGDRLTDAGGVAVESGPPREEEDHQTLQSGRASMDS